MRTGASNYLYHEPWPRQRSMQINRRRVRIAALLANFGSAYIFENVRIYYRI